MSLLDKLNPLKRKKSYELPTGEVKPGSDSRGNGLRRDQFEIFVDRYLDIQEKNREYIVSQLESAESGYAELEVEWDRLEGKGELNAYLDGTMVLTTEIGEHELDVLEESHIARRREDENSDYQSREVSHFFRDLSHI